MKNFNMTKKNFKELMPFLRGLDEEEMRILKHKIRNQSRGEEQEFEQQLWNLMANKNNEKQLAQLSEEENFNDKNRYRQQKIKMDHADKKRMPVDQSKVKDLLRNQGEFRDKMNQEVGTYQNEQRNTQLENGILTYLNEGTFGDMKELVKDVGISSDTIEFYNVQDL